MPMCAQLLAACLALALLAGVSADATVKECTGKKIAVLDLGDLAEIGGFPKCHLDEVVKVNPGNGIVYTIDAKIDNPAPHMFGTHAAPWFLTEAIYESPYYTTNLEEADIVYVYDYCYYIWWLGWVHTKGREHLDTPGDHLFAAYTAMMDTPKWKANSGKEFVFYDSHPGFAAGKAARPVQNMKCVDFRDSTHIIVDLPMRNVCPTFWLIKKILVTPYVPGQIDPDHPDTYLSQPMVPLAQRDILVYSRARCQPYQGHNAGKKMRYHFGQKTWHNTSADVDVKCTDGEFGVGHQHESFPVMYNKMRRSVFCMAFPGDAASTRRLSEIFLAGCIPVFTGPPYHSMPFSETVDYANLGVFFNLSEYSHWLLKPFKWKLHPTIRAEHETEARWWVPDAPVEHKMIQVPSADHVLHHLRSIPPKEVEQKLQGMYEASTRFAFLQRLTEPPNAINSLLAGICMKHNEFGG